MVVELPHPDGDRNVSAQEEKMLCPVCRVKLVMTARQNVEIDYCPECRGVWLDRGELDKIIERSAERAALAPTRRKERPDDRRDTRRRDNDDDCDRKYRSKRDKYEKNSVAYWLKEIFD